MAEKLFKTRIQVRRDTTANWLLNKDVIPAEGEPCLDLDTGLVKYGRGKQDNCSNDYGSSRGGNL